MEFIKAMFFLKKYTDWPKWVEISYKVIIWAQLTWLILLITLIIK